MSGGSPERAMAPQAATASDRSVGHLLTESRATVFPQSWRRQKPGWEGGEELVPRFRVDSGLYPPRPPAWLHFILTPGGPMPTSQLSWAPPDPRVGAPPSPSKVRSCPTVPMRGQALGITSQRRQWSQPEPPHPCISPPPPSCETGACATCPLSSSSSVLLSQTRWQEGRGQAAGAETTSTLGPYGAWTRHPPSPASVSSSAKPG